MPRIAAASEPPTPDARSNPSLPAVASGAGRDAGESLFGPGELDEFSAVGATGPGADVMLFGSTGPADT